MLVRSLSFQEIQIIWSQRLWPERRTKIEPVSWINSKGEIDMSMNLGEPKFWGLVEGHGIFGVISGFKTDALRFRSRGLWIDPSLRGKGWGRKLVLAAEAQALKENCSYIWTMPRSSAWGFYQKSGFYQIGHTDQFEFGPHILAEKRLTI